ncbi:unnamed protein product [Pleuronectes platessa]|uniref:LITAF domain-containing protein n=1 Tax=Pleuronectes platessa TaxID=8262 RepID=A0A9N7YAS0_PLEPL|nr:unnamed protein product [Pleuronectes platessa]
MESLSKVDEAFPSPPPYFLQDESQTGKDVMIYHIHSPFSPPPPPPSFSFASDGRSSQSHLPLPVSGLYPCIPRPKFVSYENELFRSPGLTCCHSCRTQVTTRLVLGCCLIPFFVKHFKDVYHICPHCRRVLHVHRKTCCG